MANDESEKYQEDTDKHVSSLLESSETLNHTNLNREVACYSWGEVSPWNTTTANVTYVTTNQKSYTKKKKGKFDYSRKLNSLNMMPDDAFVVQSRRNISRRNYGTMSYDTPTWRFIVNAKTFEYISRSDPNRTQMNGDTHRTENKSANYRDSRVAKGKRDSVQLDPAMFFDDQLSVALVERDSFVSLRLQPRLRQLNGIDFGSSLNDTRTNFKKSGACLNYIKNDIVPGGSLRNEACIIGCESIVGPMKDMDFIDQTNAKFVGKRTLTEQLQAASAHFKRETFNIKTSSMELDPKTSSREVHHRSQIMLNRVKLLHECGHKKLENKMIEPKQEKFRRSLSKKNLQGSKKMYPQSLRYSDLGLPILPKVFTDEAKKEYIGQGLYVNSITKELTVPNGDSLNLSDDIHLPSIAQESIESDCNPNIFWEENKGTLLPPIFGTKMELSVSNSNQSLL